MRKHRATRATWLFAMLSLAPAGVAQLQANLNQSPAASGLSANILPADLSAQNRPSDQALNSSSGGRMPTNVSPALLADLSARAAARNKYQQMLYQDLPSPAAPTPLRPGLHNPSQRPVRPAIPFHMAASRSLAAPSPLFTIAPAAPRSFATPSLAARTPLYSTLMNHESGHSQTTRQLMNKPGQRKKSGNGRIQSMLPGAGDSRMGRP